MRVRLAHTWLLHDLLRYLRECGCVAEQASANEADVYLPSARDRRSARGELEVYVTAWRVRNGGADARVLYDAPVARQPRRFGHLRV